MRRFMIWGGLATAIVLVAFIAVGWVNRLESGWWGAVGQWFGAVGSIIAAGVALYVADLGRRETEKQRQDDEKIQARLIFGEYRPRTGLLGDLVVVNRSGGFILDPTVLSLSIDARYGVGEWFIGSVDGEIVDHFPRVVVNEVEARRRTDALTVFFKTAEGIQQAAPEVQPVVTMRFIDADGRGWIRRGREEPQRWMPPADKLVLPG